MYSLDFEAADIEEQTNEFPACYKISVCNHKIYGINNDQCLSCHKNSIFIENECVEIEQADSCDSFVGDPQKCNSCPEGLV